MTSKTTVQHDISCKGSLEACRAYETELSNHLSGAHVSPIGLVEILDHVQQSSKSALLLDLEIASANSVEERLWTSHQKIHNYYRSIIAKLRGEKDQKTVELRKLTGHYIKFLKCSQSFYRGYIWGLNQVHGGIPELERCAQAVRPHDHQVTDSGKSTISKELVLRSCHRSLIQLGDLSRYRENANLDKDCKWGPAIGYYELADSILPASGFPSNQLAVLQLTIGNQFKAIYYLYRSLATQEPHPQAQDNLRRAFGRLRSAWDSGLMLKNDTATSSAGASKLLLLWYLRYLEVSYHARGIAGYDELDREVNERLKSDLEKGKMDPTLRRVVLINIAGCFQSRRRMMEASTKSLARPEQSYQMSLRLALTIFTTLLKILENELEDMPCGENLAPSQSRVSELFGQVTVKLEDILPSLRLYSLWLNSEATDLSQSLDKDDNETCAIFWTEYARCLTLLADKFPPSGLATLQSTHALSEDTDINGFTPLQCSANQWLLHQDSARTLQSNETETEKLNPMYEILTRIRDVLSIAVNLTQISKVPLSLSATEAKFIYSPTKGSGALDTFIVGSGVRENMQSQPMSMHSQDEGRAFQRSSLVEAANGTLPEAMHDVRIERMVDDLVGSTSEMDVSKSVDSLPEYNEPTTPPPAILLGQITTSVTPSSSYSIGTHTANALLDAVQNYSQNRKGDDSSQKEPNTSQSKPKSHLPAVGAQPVHLSSSRTAQDPSTSTHKTSHRNSFSFENFRTPSIPASPRQNTTQKSSPLEPSLTLRHCRGGSNDSTNNIWSIPASTWNSSKISNSISGHSYHLGNGTFGTVSTGLMNSGNSIVNTSGQGSALGATSNPWTVRSGDLPPTSRVSSSISATVSPWSNHHNDSPRTSGGPLVPRGEMASSMNRDLDDPLSTWAPK